ncbi:MAG: ATP-binding protein, partial [Chloroflexota bacterium]
IVDLMADPRNVGAARESIQKTRDKSAIIVPLLVGHNIIGSLAVVNGRYSRVFNQEDVNIVTTMANQASLAIRNGQLYKAAQEADRLKSIFLASMSHELRTPLNSIIGFTGIILQELAGPLNREQMKQMGMVRGSAHHLLDLINDVLDISKIEAGQLQVSQESCNVHEIVAKVLQSLTPDAEKKGLALTAVLTPHSTEISSDKRRVEQILINLVNNGIKFTDRGTVQVQTKVQDDWLLVKVIDTGIGIKEKDIEKLFNPFQQIETGLNRVHEGTGLGLSICQRLVHLLGGEISVVSEWGMGSTFSFILPL